MFIGGSIALIAIGAILRYAVEETVTGINLPVVGLILMITGAIGLVAALIETALASSRRRGF